MMVVIKTSQPRAAIVNGVNGHNREESISYKTKGKETDKIRRRLS